MTIYYSYYKPGEDVLTPRYVGIFNGKKSYIQSMMDDANLLYRIDNEDSLEGYAYIDGEFTEEEFYKRIKEYDI